MAEAAQVKGVMPDTASLTLATQTSQYVSSVTYAQTSASVGVITASAKGEAKISAAGSNTITLTGTLNSTGQVDWVCGGTIDSKYRPASCK
ncbi:MAG: pilin [Burkholderiaceae bacterium]|nr:pilin [Burkholderiaceae bacterium]